MTQHYTHTEDYVKNFYEKIGITKPQELEFRAIAEQLGIYVFYWSDASQALFTGNKGFILLNESLTTQQQWQEFCHELAHVLFHAGKQSKIPASFREYQEAKANIFMYHAAIPTFMLDNLKPTSLTVSKIAALFCVELEFAQQRLDHYIAQQYRFTMPIWNT